MSAPAADLTTLLQAGALGQRTDRELLDRFINGRGSPAAEAAFAVLVARHGPMVLGVCRRMLGGDPHAAADAFQATFLVLVRRAPAVRVDDSLGRWLHGVSVRVARKARTRNQSDRARSRPLESIDPPAPSVPDDDLRGQIDAEVARLPRPLRAAVVLCDLEGLTHDQAARRLRCPVGTVHSRVHRARQRLRAALSRKGLAPSSVLALPPVEVPAALAVATVIGAGRVAGAGRLAGVVSPGVVALARFTFKEWMMIPGWMAPTVAAAALTLAATGANGTADAPAPPQTTPPAPAARADQPPPSPAPDLNPTVAERFAWLRRQYDHEVGASHQAQVRAASHREQREIREKMAPDDVAYCRRMIDLARANPVLPGARDALVWVLDFPGRIDTGEYGDEFARAAALLARHHGNDPEAVRIGLTLDNLGSPHRDALLAGFMASAKGREAKGLARMAMAQSLARKRESAIAARKQPERLVLTYRASLDDEGKLVDRTIPEADEDYARRMLDALCDPDQLRSETERLCREVIAEYGDIPYLTVFHRKVDAAINDPNPTWNGQPLDDSYKAKLTKLNARRTTLGVKAAELLESWIVLSPGQPAPAIAENDIHGKPLDLASHRGKVVALVFWESYCGLCRREIPRTKALLKKYESRPFALLGVVSGVEREEAADAIAEEEITWPHWYDGIPGEGAIARRYHVKDRHPTAMVIDAAGEVRRVNIAIEELDAAVETLLNETTPTPKPSP